jgi:hypothetical protein
VKTINNHTAFGVFQVVISAFYSYLMHKLINVSVDSQTGEITIIFHSHIYGNNAMYLCQSLKDKDIVKDVLIYTDINDKQVKIYIDGFVIAEEECRDSYTYNNNNPRTYTDDAVQLYKMTNFAVESFLRPHIDSTL